MGKTMSLASPADAVDYDATLIMALETSDKSWVVAAHAPGLGHIKAKQTIGRRAEALARFGPSVDQRTRGLRRMLTMEIPNGAVLATPAQRLFPASLRVASVP
jgi:hypothetical protein